MMPITVILSILFFVSEISLLLFRRSKEPETKTRKDRGSLLLFWATIPLFITLGFFHSYDLQWKTLNYAVGFTGYLFIFMGIWLRWAAILQLKSSFTVNVAIGREQKLKTDGLYKRVRHPSYSGMILIITGLGLAMNTWLSALLVIIPITAAIIYRIKVEEHLLSDYFGEVYKAYKNTTYTLVPWVY